MVERDVAVPPTASGVNKLGASGKSSMGRYIPPARLRKLLEEQEQDKSQNNDDGKTSKEVQRVKWDVLKKQINGAINKANTENLGIIVRELFGMNIQRGRGTLCKSIMRSQAQALDFTPVYASLVSILNTKLPEIGNLLAKRLVIQFRRSFKRSDKTGALSSGLFLSHLVNQRVVHEIVVLEALQLLVHSNSTSNENCETAVAITRTCGSFLLQECPLALNQILERFRQIIHENSKLDTRTRFLVEKLLQDRRKEFDDYPVIPEGLDLVEEEDQVTHTVKIDDPGLKSEDTLNVFRYDETYDESEKKYEELKKTILGEDEEEEEGEEEEEEETHDEANEQFDNERERYEQEGGLQDTKGDDENEPVIDMTDSERADLRRKIYLTVMSTMSIDEITHKLMKLNVADDQYIVDTLIECCSHEKTYNRIFGGVSQRLCRKTRRWHELFVDAFRKVYNSVHQYTVAQSRNVARLFGVLLASDSLDWSVFECVYMNEQDSNASNRVFLKDLFEEMKRELGINKIEAQMQEPYLQPYLGNMFPCGSQVPIADTVFSINYFTAIGLGKLTDGMRDWLEEQQRRDQEQDSVKTEDVESQYDGAAVKSEPDEPPIKEENAPHTNNLKRKQEFEEDHQYQSRRRAADYM